MKRVAVSCLLSIAATAALAQGSPWLFTAGNSTALSTNAAQLSNEYFRVEQWGLLTMRTTLWHGEWLYPTANDRNPAGPFVIDAHKFAAGDFDGDGAKDVFVNAVVFPHTLVRPPIAPVLLRNVKGLLHYWPDGWSGPPPQRLFSYKAVAADFNRDGRADVVTGSGGIITRNADGTYTNHWEPIATAMSTSAGRLADASRMVSGQESGGVMPGFSFAHDLAVGDVNGDGFLDMYQGRALLLGDGRGGFVRRNDLLPADAADPRRPPVMSSAIGDLDGDGVGDLVIAYFDGHGPLNGAIFLSDGRGGIAQGRHAALPVGRYGLGTTKHNDMRIADLDGDGRPDIVIGQTRANPYYRGRAVQIIMNRGNGQFVDESSRVSGDDRDGAHGEGDVTLIDINGDGHVDIVDAGLGPAGFAVFVNDGRGHFTRIPPGLFPFVRNRDLVTHERLAPGDVFGDSTTGNPTIFPVLLDGNGVSYLVQFQPAPTRWPPVEGDASERTLYVIRALKPYGRAAAPAGLAPGDNVTGLWWNAAESGWGLSLNHQGSMLFGALFTYSADGSGMWLVMTAGQRQADGSFSGTLYQTTGPAFKASPFLPLGGGVGSVTVVGTMRVAFADRNRATLTYSYNGVSVTKSITPQVFSSAITTCSPTIASRTTRTNYTDLWWVPDESGWGVNFAHQGETLFGTLFTYAPGTSASNPGMWLVMSAGQRQPDASYRGDLYRVNGPVFNAVPFAPVGAGNATRVGTMQVRFHDGERATLQYDVGGAEVIKQIVPQVFGAERPSCRSAG